MKRRQKKAEGVAAGGTLTGQENPQDPSRGGGGGGRGGAGRGARGRRPRRKNESMSPPRLEDVGAVRKICAFGVYLPRRSPTPPYTHTTYDTHTTRSAGGHHSSLPM